MGWIEKIDHSKGGFVVTCALNYDVAPQRIEFEAKAASVAQTFREFIQSLSPLSQVDRVDEELIDALVNWLVLLDILSEEDLRSVSQVERIGKRLVYQVTTPDEVRVDDMAYLCARFADHIVRTDSELSTFLIELASVGLITEVVRDFQKPATSVSKTDLCVYLDAPVALDLLGLSGSEPKSNINTILQKIRSLGGSVRIYRISVEEMETNLSALLGRSPSDREGATAEALRRGEVLEQFVRQVATNADPFLTQIGVSIVDRTLDQFPNDHKFFEQAAVDSMYSQVGWVRDDLPRFHDAATTALTIRGRRGVRSGDLFQVKHLLVTRNPFFPGLARRVSLDFAYINARQVGPVVHQRQLATAVWLRAGLGLSDEEIPRKYILSACRRVLTLRKNIVEKVRQVSDSLTKQQAEQLELLLTQGRSTQVLMDKTLGAATVINASNVALLVEEMRNALVQEERNLAAEKIDQVRREAKQQKREFARCLIPRFDGAI